MPVSLTVIISSVATTSDIITPAEGPKSIAAISITVSFASKVKKFTLMRRTNIVANAMAQKTGSITIRLESNFLFSLFKSFTSKLNTKWGNGIRHGM